MGFKHNDRCLAKVADNEPIFVLRAQDSSAPSVIRDWVTRNEHSLTPEHIDEALNCANAMEIWHTRRSPT